MIAAAAADSNVERARELVLRFGWNATVYQILNPGIAHWFSSAGDAVLGYARFHGVYVVAGAPVCDESRLPEVVDEFEREVRARGSRVCYFGAEGRLERSLRGDATRAFADEGAAYATLGLSPLSRRAHLDETINPVWLRLVLALVRAHGRRFYNFDGLDAFKAKLAPERWEPVYAIADERRVLPRTLLAIASAFSGGSPVAFVARAMLGAARMEAVWALDRVRG